MESFAALFTALDGTTRTKARVAALAGYFRTAPPGDRLWTIALLSGRRPRRSVSTAELRQWAAEAAGIPLWLFETAYPVVGDLAETIALVLPAPKARPMASPDAPSAPGPERSLADWIEGLRSLQGADTDTRRAYVLDAWSGLDATGRFVFNKLITGGFRMGVSQGLMTRALAEATGIDAALIAHRLMGDWTPDTTSFDRLVLQDSPGDAAARPYPFCLAHGLSERPEALGDPGAWFADWKWDGIRGQLIRRAGDLQIWSRGEELMTDRFPELHIARDLLPDGCVLDGELLAWAEGAPLPFAALQRRIGRKSVPKRLLAEAPVILCAYDLLEWQGTDLRARPFAERRALLEAAFAPLPAQAPLRLAPEIPFDDWQGLAAIRAQARSRRAEGVMLKRRDSPYHAGRKRGDWWKWKLDPRSVDAVMIYAQAGHGRRATLYTDFTFALRDGDDLVPFAKAYSGLTDAEFAEITRWVRRNTLERFGPVRRVKPELVFEIAFEGIQESPRHRSGLALRFPRMLRWRRDKRVAEIDRIESLRAMLEEP